jgi:hypothetical protein
MTVQQSDAFHGNRHTLVDGPPDDQLLGVYIVMAIAFYLIPA